MTYVIEHQPSGDVAEADDPAGALCAARTLLDDNEREGTCRVFHGRHVRAIVWPGKHADEQYRLWSAL